MLGGSGRESGRGGERKARGRLLRLGKRETEEAVKEEERKSESAAAKMKDG